MTNHVASEAQRHSSRSSDLWSTVAKCVRSQLKTLGALLPSVQALQRNVNPDIIAKSCASGAGEIGQGEALVLPMANPGSVPLLPGSVSTTGSEPKALSQEQPLSTISCDP